MTSGVIGGLRIGSPLALDEERRLYPIIEAGRAASARLASGEVAPDERRRLARVRLDGSRAESALLTATLGLVRARVTERGYHFGGDELEAAGVEGLANAMRRFDPSHGARFATYANYWITKLVNQAIQLQAGLTDTEMRRALAVQKLQRSSAEPVTARVVARELGLDPRRAAEALQVARDLAARRFATSALDDAARAARAERGGRRAGVGHRRAAPALRGRLRRLLAAHVPHRVARGARARAGHLAPGDVQAHGALPAGRAREPVGAAARGVVLAPVARGGRLLRFTPPSGPFPDSSIGRASDC